MTDIIMSVVMGIFCLLVGYSLWKIHTDPHRPDLLDLITATDRTGRTRFDARKCFEAGAFGVSSWAFVFLTMSGKMTEYFFAGYMAAWVGARFLRDREQRLSNAQEKP